MHVTRECGIEYLLQLGDTYTGYDTVTRHSEGKSRWICESEVSLGHTVSSKTVTSMQSDPVLTNNDKNLQ